MSKEEFFSTLDSTQQEYVDFLIDCAYSQGYNRGQLDAVIS